MIPKVSAVFRVVIPVFSLYSETEQFPLSLPEGRSLDRLCPVPEKIESKKALTVVCINGWVGLAKEKRKIGVLGFTHSMHCRKGMQLKYNKKLLVNTTGWKKKRYEKRCLTQNVKKKILNLNLIVFFRKTRSLK